MDQTPNPGFSNEKPSGKNQIEDPELAKKIVENVKDKGGIEIEPLLKTAKTHLEEKLDKFPDADREYIIDKRKELLSIVAEAPEVTDESYRDQHTKERVKGFIEAALNERRIFYPTKRGAISKEGGYEKSSPITSLESLYEKVSERLSLRFNTGLFSPLVLPPREVNVHDEFIVSAILTLDITPEDLPPRLKSEFPNSDELRIRYDRNRETSENNFYIEGYDTTSDPPRRKPTKSVKL